MSDRYRPSSFTLSYFQPQCHLDHLLMIPSGHHSTLNRVTQLISEAYDILKTIGGLTNEELAATFTEWNK